MRSRSLIPALAAGLVLFPAAVGSAHIRISSPTPRSTTVLKDRHCGATGSARANVQTLPPGAVVHLVWDEYIPHPGWFRISFQENGDIFRIPPESNGPTGGGAPSNYPTEDLTGQIDPDTGSLIIADRIAHGTLSFDVTLPNVECANCTLQLTQMMTDKPPYSIALDSNDIYYTCVDLVLSATAPDANPAAPDADPGNPGSPDAGSGGGGTTGGCSSSGGGSSGILTVLALVLLSRRRRTRA
jgi:uncharacterized protein (TIGR03382 family)